MSDVLLIDQGYFVFYRYYATEQWYKHSHQDSKFDNIEDDPEFQDMLKKRLLSSLEELVKKYRVNWNRVFVCCDGSRSLLWRTQNLKNDYKSHRSAPSGIGLAFRYMTEHTNQLKTTVGMNVLKHPQMEADDIVATCHTFLRKTSPESNIRIIATDADYFQLLDKNTILSSLNKRDPTKNSLGDPAMDLRVKIIQGDVSDGITSCFPRCGRKTAIKLAHDNNLLDTYFKKYPDSSKIFEFNRQMIDFRYIPQELTNSILDELKTISI